MLNVLKIVVALENIFTLDQWMLKTSIFVELQVML